MLKPAVAVIRVDEPVQNNRLPLMATTGSGKRVPADDSVANGRLVQLLVMVAVTVTGVEEVTVYQSIVTELVPCPAVTDPAAAGDTVQFTVQLAGSEEILIVFCPLLHRLVAGEIVGLGIVSTFTVAGTEGQPPELELTDTLPEVKFDGQVTCTLLPALITVAVPGNTVQVMLPLPVAVYV